MFRIVKEFPLCYGHRVHTQRLDNTLALTTQHKCRHLHGHEAIVRVALAANKLNDGGMVTDFLHLTVFKKWLDDVLDHRFILDRNDPLFEFVRSSFWEYTGTTAVPIENDQDVYGIEDYMIYDIPFMQSRFKHGGGLKIQQKSEGEKAAMLELLGSLVVVPFVPTSENLAKWMYTVVKTLVVEPLRAQEPQLKVEFVTWQETPKSRSTYEPHFNA